MIPAPARGRAYGPLPVKASAAGVGEAAVPSDDPVEVGVGEAVVAATSEGTEVPVGVWQAEVVEVVERADVVVVESGEVGVVVESGSPVVDVELVELVELDQFNELDVDDG